MIKITDKSQCTGCTACQSVCSRNAITMQDDEYGQIYPKVSIDLCINCGLCEKVCPLMHQERIPCDVNIDDLEVKAIYNKDSEIRRKSTSGGIFSLLAEYIIRKGGIVCAARFDENYHISHAFFDSMDQIDPFRGSKYAQSDIKDIFHQIKEYLKNHYVLFVGTPCQVAGLKSYLIKDYENLYTCDFVCMSISSGKMWDEYILDYQRQHQIKRIFFKDKRIGWHKSDWRMLIEDERGEQLCKGFDNPYFFTYLMHYSARPSCFLCVFRHCRHMSDFTIADCWGIDSVYPDFDDNKGCTSLILQSYKSKIVFEAIKDKTCFRDYGVHNIRRYNRHIEHQADMPKDYDQFCCDYVLQGFMFATKKAMQSYKRLGMICRLKQQIKRIIK